MHIIKETKDEQGRHHSYNDEPAIVYRDGDKYWYCRDKLHRENDPAVICSNGDKYWYRHGERHRDNGPAGEFSNGDKEWWYNGKLHRDNGPAIEYNDGDKFWYIHGKECAFHNWVKLSSLSEDQKIELLLSYDHN